MLIRIELRALAPKWMQSFYRTLIVRVAKPPVRYAISFTTTELTCWASIWNYVHSSHALALFVVIHQLNSSFGVLVVIIIIIFHSHCQKSRSSPAMGRLLAELQNCCFFKYYSIIIATKREKRTPFRSTLVLFQYKFRSKTRLCDGNDGGRTRFLRSKAVFFFCQNYF